MINVVSFKKNLLVLSLIVVTVFSLIISASFVRYFDDKECSVKISEVEKEVKFLKEKNEQQKLLIEEQNKQLLEEQDKQKNLLKATDGNVNAQGEKAEKPVVCNVVLELVKSDGQKKVIKPVKKVVKKRKNNVKENKEDKKPEVHNVIIIEDEDIQNSASINTDVDTNNISNIVNNDNNGNNDSNNVIPKPESKKKQ